MHHPEHLLIDDSQTVCRRRKIKAIGSTESFKKNIDFYSLQEKNISYYKCK